MGDLSRRHFLACCGLAAPALAACRASPTGSDDTTSDDTVQDDVTAGVTVLADSIRLRLSMLPALRQAGGSHVIAEANVIVVQPSLGDYRAFSNICTHAGCGIYLFVAARLRCQCHGSEFDGDGLNVAGPAPSPLPRLTVASEEGGAVLRVARR